MGKQNKKNGNKYPDITFRDKDVDKITAGSDTTVIKKPYRVTSAEFNSGLGPATSLHVSDSTRKKIDYNLNEVVPSYLKRNAERKKEGKQYLTYKSITGQGPGEDLSYGFSNIGKSFSSSPIKNKNSSSPIKKKKK